MSEGNGTDLGHVVAMIESVIVGQEAMRGEVRSEIAGLRGDIAALRADHGRRLDRLETGLNQVVSDVAGLRDAVTQYHGSVMGHGILLTEHDERLRRVEQHLGLPPAA
jgi:hypothetical protein